MDVKRKFRISAIVSTTLLVVAGIVGVVSDLKNLSEKIHFLPVGLALVALGGVVAGALMWKSYLDAMREIERNRNQRPSGFVALGMARGEAELSREVRRMMQKKGISEIDIGGLALRANFFRKRSPFSEQLLLLLRNNKQARVRVWLLDPRSEAVKMREVAERQKKDGLLQVACRESLESLRDIVLTIWRE